MPLGQWPSKCDTSDILFSIEILAGAFLPMQLLTVFALPDHFCGLTSAQVSFLYTNFQLYQCFWSVICLASLQEKSISPLALRHLGSRASRPCDLGWAARASNGFEPPPESSPSGTQMAKVSMLKICSVDAH